MKLIDKEKVVAEIKTLRDRAHELYGCSQFDTAYNNVLDSIDILETKEVDLEEALSDLDKDIKEFVTTEEFEKDSAIYGHYWAIAKHAFLLGLKTKKGE